MCGVDGGGSVALSSTSGKNRSFSDMVADTPVATPKRHQKALDVRRASKNDIVGSHHFARKVSHCRSLASSWTFAPTRPSITPPTTRTLSSETIAVAANRSIARRPFRSGRKRHIRRASRWLPSIPPATQANLISLEGVPKQFHTPYRPPFEFIAVYSLSHLLATERIPVHLFLRITEKSEDERPHDQSCAGEAGTYSQNPKNKEE